MKQRRCYNLSGWLGSLSTTPAGDQSPFALIKWTRYCEEILLGFLDSGEESTVITKPTNQNLKGNRIMLRGSGDATIIDSKVWVRLKEFKNKCYLWLLSHPPEYITVMGEMFEWETMSFSKPLEKGYHSNLLLNCFQICLYYFNLCAK